jgi:TusA-related sulfurtransferase
MRVVDVRGLKPTERQMRVKKVSMEIAKGEVMKVVSDDPRMPQLASKIVKALGGLDLIKVEEKNGLFYAYLKKV